MMATTIFCWLQVPNIAPKYKTALIITGLVTFIASYHYMRIFDSWNTSYEWVNGGQGLMSTGKPFNDAYRYMDWLLTVPLLLVEIVLVMKLDAEESRSKCVSLGSAGALMILLGYPGELELETSALKKRWFYWLLAMIPFVYIVYTLLIGSAEATHSESNPRVRKLIRWSQWATVVSWCTYPIVYLFPMLGIQGNSVIVAIQLGYSVSDILWPSAVSVCWSTASHLPKASPLNRATAKRLHSMDPQLKKTKKTREMQGLVLALLLLCNKKSKSYHNNLLTLFFRRA